MSSYQLYEGSIQIPDGWKDQTMNAFALPESNGKGAKASFVVSRDYNTKSETIEHYADLQLVEAAKKLPKYKLIRRSEIKSADNRRCRLIILGQRRSAWRFASVRLF